MGKQTNIMDGIFNNWANISALGAAGLAACTVAIRLLTVRTNRDGTKASPPSLTPYLNSRMDGKVVLITGGTSGVGYQTAVALAKAGARLIITSRSSTRALDAAKLVAEDAFVSCAQIDGVALDVSSLESVKRCAAEIVAKYSRLDALVHNAGNVSLDHPITGEGGLDWEYTTRVASTHLLTSLLWSLLSSSGTL